jgi:hypothetical protein
MVLPEASPVAPASHSTSNKLPAAWDTRSMATMGAVLICLLGALYWRISIKLVRDWINIPD